MEPTSASRQLDMETAILNYSEALQSNEEVMQYLVEGRGLAEETVRTFRLGVVEEPEPQHISKRGMIAIPYLGIHGRPVAIRFHCFKKHDHSEFFHSKYMTETGDPARMFNAHSITSAGSEIHVAEGEFDAMILNQVGFPAVAAPGAQSWKRRHRIMLAGFSHVWIWADPDEAGAELANKISRSLSQARTIRLSGGDVSDLYAKGGEKYLHDIFEKTKRFNN